MGGAGDPRFDDDHHCRHQRGTRSITGPLLFPVRIISRLTGNIPKTIPRPQQHRVAMYYTYHRHHRFSILGFPTSSQYNGCWLGFSSPFCRPDPPPPNPSRSNPLGQKRVSAGNTKIPEGFKCFPGIGGRFILRVLIQFF
ncbi:MAG: hypothetical protein CM15mP45_12410 [Deltaproteobacteria bacterium]|nr:MAG: hypothetical protein CM15mP45_12410 [Deltaproteobacteria bacterium]